MLKTLEKRLIVSCQAPIDSPLHDPQIIAAIARASVLQGAVGVRIDTPSHVQATRQTLPETPIIGLWKQQIPGYEVYITPRFQDAVAIAEAGADIIAIDATLRDRPEGETVSNLIAKIHDKLEKLVMADIDDFASASQAVEAGADLVGTTLYGYTKTTSQNYPPGWELLSQIAEKLNVPVICEGGVSSPEMAKKALDLGAHTVVVGTAITGIDLKVKAFQAVFE